jgi:hypothetical protein
MASIDESGLAGKTRDEPISERLGCVDEFDQAKAGGEADD